MAPDQVALDVEDIVDGELGAEEPGAASLGGPVHDGHEQLGLLWQVVREP
jgi:hypothetical protein